MSIPRAAIVVTGTEVLGGWVSDRNGPWLAQQLGAVGVDHVSTTVVGDRPEDLWAALDHARASGIDLVVTSGGLGPTEDDLTAAVVADFAGRPMELDEALEGRIWAIIEPLAKRWGHTDPAALRAANRKQALVPVGATVLEPVGTAPGLIVPPADGTSGPTVLVLPGPPRELQPMWRTAIAVDAFQAAIPGAEVRGEQILRVYGLPEAQLADTMREARAAGIELDAIEVTTCAHRGELEIVNRWAPARAAVAESFAAFVAERHGELVFSQDGRTIDELVFDLLRERGWTVATAESCTGGLVAGRLTDRAGSSEVMAGGVVAYADEVKRRALGVDGALLAEHGAVSAPVAQAMAVGALDRIGADVAVATTGIAGPGGGSEAKPVGTIFLAVAARDGASLVRHVRIPGDRFAIRDRTTTAALHLLRRLLRGETDAG
ncbi:Competence/damage-inducible protein CinA [Patulibacter medicamentivorans]|uniref:CinA-like protein n=1 Tax=Patulibacter medicamentivorans TaxID=1097667 RepID=H0E2U7_9ACTN|nr:competence/damage-inducible protein A [Patulibacter medicamentivorans]EHN12025.1 Competence/damage-inducible protein CinA [Patulibacter medicamentivorans]